MSNRYVNVVITRQTQAISQQGFGLPLILSTEIDKDYAEYTELAAVGAAYGENTETYKLASKVFGQSPRPEKVAVFGFVYDEVADEPTALTGALNELVKSENDFFYLLSNERGIEEVIELDNWTNAQNKFYVTVVNDEALLAQLTGKNTIVFVSDTPTDYSDGALVGRIAPLEIGSYTVTFKTLDGLSPSNFDETKLGDIEEAGGTAYIRVGGVNIVSKGQTVTGEYIDILQGQYYLEARLTENIFGLLVRQPKIPFTYNGISLIVAEVEKTLKDGVARGIIATDEGGKGLYTITVPDLASISTNDKALRKLNGIKWTATIAGAVEDVDIQGTFQL